MLSSADSDYGLVRQAQNGSSKAFEVLVAKYQQKVFSQCFFLLGQNRQDAEDAAQEVLTGVWRNIKGFNFEAKFSTWLYTVTRNHCLNVMKQRNQKHESIEESKQAMETAGNPADESSATEDCVRQKVKLLDELHRTVIALVHFDGFSYEEAAERLGCAVGTVRSRLNRALQELRPLIRECV